MRVCFVYGAPRVLEVVVDFPLEWVACEASGVQGVRAVDTVRRVEGVYDPTRRFFHTSNALRQRVVAQALRADALLTALHTEEGHASASADEVERLFYQGLMQGAGGGEEGLVWRPLYLPGRFGWNVVAVESAVAC